MINFRFHIVSLIAIFLALALGVVVGAGVIDRGVVDTLEASLDRVEARSNEIRDENRELATRNSQQSQAITDVQPYAVSGQLLGDDVGIVAMRGIDDSRVAALVTATQQADATVTGTLWLEDRWDLADDGDVSALQDALGTTTRNKARLRAEAFQRVAQRLAVPTAGESEGDLLDVLQQAGFVGFDAVDDSTITSFPGRGAGVVLVLGNGASVSTEDVVLPATTALRGADLSVVVAAVWADVSDGPDRGDVLRPIRDDDLARTVSTVDDLDLEEGPTTVVLAMSDLFRTPPVVGHYGYGPNTQPLPEPVGSEP